MNPEKPSREDIEIKLTALLLGELSAEEAQSLRTALAQDAELQKLHDELQSTISLVREVVNTPVASDSTLKLSNERRQKLLAQFQTPKQQATAPKPDALFWLKRIDMSRLQAPRLLTVLAVLAIVALLAAIMLPALSKAKERAKRVAALSGEQLKEVEKSPAGVDRLGVSGWASSAITPAEAPAPATPAVVTMAPETVLAPPPVAIVLPSTEAEAVSSDTLAKRTDDTPALYYRTLDEQAKFKGALEKQPAQTRMAMVEKQWALPAQNFDSPVAGGSGGGGGGGGGAGNFQFETSAARQNRGETFALSDSDGKLGAAKNLGEEYRWSGAAAQPVIDPQTGLPASGPVGRGGDAWQDTTVAYGLAGQQTPATKSLPGSASDQMAISGLRVERQTQMRSTEVATVINGANFQQGASAMTANKDTVPAAGDLTVSGQLFQSQSKVAPPSGTVAANNTWEYATRAPATTPVAAAAPIPSQAPTSRLRTDVLASGKTEDTESSRQKLAVQDKLDAATLTLAGNVSINGGVNGTAQNRLEVAQDESKNKTMGYDWYMGDANGGKMQAQNAPVPAKSSATAEHQFSGQLAVGDSGVVAGNTFGDSGGLRYVTKTKLQKALTKDQSQGSVSVQELEQLKAQHQLLAAKIEAERQDQTVPRTSMVQIVDRAEPSKDRSFWQSLKGEYASNTRIKIENDVNDMSAGHAPTAAQMSYDPYFVQTTFEIIQSEAVLGRVVDTLKLDETWSKKDDHEKLTKAEAIAQLKKQLSLKPVKNTKLIAVTATSANAEEAAQIANAVAEAYQAYRLETRRQTAARGVEVLEQQYLEESNRIQQLQQELDKSQPAAGDTADKPLPKPALNALIPQPEYLSRENNFSTFSLNVSDVSFKLAAASLGRGQLPEAAAIRSEEFINAFNYRDPEAAAGQPLAFASERARYPFAVNRDLLRFSVKTAAAGRAEGRALNLVLLLDNSGSMERADRVAIIREALRVLGSQLQSQDQVSVVTFARTARLWADGVSGGQANEALQRVGGITPEGGTNLEEAMRLAYETSHRHYLANGLNRVVLITDGAANLGNVDAAALKASVEAQRKQGIALDCFGIGFEDYNDDLLQQLSSNGDGRYAFLNSTEDASKEFAAKLAGALQVAAQDVKVQVEFNPQRVVSWRQIGYAKHQLKKEQFRDNTVDAAEIAAQEAGNALYTVETKPDGVGPIATVRVRYKVPGTSDYRERSWDVAYEGAAPALTQASPAMRLAATAGAFSEWLAASPFAQQVTLEDLQKILGGVPQVYGADKRPQQLETMLREAKSITGQ